MSLGDYPIDTTQTPRRSLFGTLLPPMGKVVAFVRHAPLDGLGMDITTNLKPTLAAALTSVVPGRGDVIVVLPGHAENVTTGTYLANLKAGTTILGLGVGANKPVFTFTATGSQWLVAAANVTFTGIQLNFGGGAAVTIGVDVTGAQCCFSGCEFITSVLSTSRADKVIRLSTGADDFLFVENVMRGANAANGVVDNILVNATVARARFMRNNMSLGVTVATVGLIRFAAIATDCLVADNYMSSNLATSSTILDFDAAATGMAINNRAAIMSDQAVNVGFTVGTSGFRFFENYVVGVVDKSGTLSPVGDT